MDIIGTIYTAAAEGETPQALAGWHVNMPTPVAGWEAKIVTPETPLRVYGGHETVFYSFASEAEFIAMATAAGLLEESTPEEGEE